MPEIKVTSFHEIHVHLKLTIHFFGEKRFKKHHFGFVLGKTPKRLH